MADDRVTFVFEAKGGEETARKMKGVAGALGTTQREADKAAKDVRELKQYLEFSKGIKSTKDLEAAMKKHPSLARKIEGAYKRLREKEVKGLTGAFKNLTAAEKRQLVQMRKLNAEVKKGRGITSSFKQGIVGAIPALGMMATGAGAVTLAGQKMIQMFSQAVDKIKEFIVSSIKLGAEEEESAAIMIALVGDLEAGTAAYNEFDKRVTDSPFKNEAYNLRDYASAVKVGMGGAYLDAAEAGDRFGFSAKSFIEMMYKLDKGLLRSASSLGQFKDVLHHTGIDIEKVKDGTISYKEVVHEMKIAVKEMADEQRDAAGITGTGALNLIRNQWIDIKEQIGIAFLQYLKPMGVEILRIMKEVRSMGELWKAVGDLIKGVAPVITLVVLPALRGLVGFMGVFNKLAEASARAWRAIAKAMGKAIPEEGAAKVNVGAYMITHPREAERPGKVDGKGFLFGEKYWEDKYKEEAPAGGPAPTGKKFEAMPSLRGRFRREDLGLTLPSEGPTGEEEAKRKAQLLTQFRAGRDKKKDAEEEKELLTRYTKVGKKAGDTMAGVFQAALEQGGITAFFKNLAVGFASTIIAALATSAVIQALTRGGGGFWSTFKTALGFEQEGAFTNISKPMPVIIHPGEHIFNQDTIAALRGGGAPAGGRPGYEYGPETYGGGYGGGGTTLVNVIRPGVNVEIETFRTAEKGRALAEMADG